MREIIFPSLLPDQHRGEAVSIAKQIGVRLANPLDALALVDAVFSSPEFGSTSAHPVSFAAGCAGFSFLMRGLECALPLENWRSAVDRHLHAASSRGRANSSLFTGWAGLLAATLYTKPSECSYVRLQETLTAHLISKASSIAASRAASKNGTALFELVLGVAGLYIVLEDAAMTGARDEILAYFAWLTDDPDEERWALPQSMSPLPEKLALNAGLSHGITGVLAALTLGPILPTSSRVANKIADWLLTSVYDEGDGPQFPSFVQDGKSVRSRAAWCYGTPGVAATLWYAGHRLEREDLKSVATKALRALSNRERTRWHVQDNAICHGKAGVALAFASVGQMAGDQALLAAASTLLLEIMADFDERTIVGYRSQAPSGMAYDSPALLDGSAGIALVLLTLTGQCDPSWTKYFGLRLNF